MSSGSLTFIANGRQHSRFYNRHRAEVLLCDFYTRRVGRQPVRGVVQHVPPPVAHLAMNDADAPGPVLRISRTFSLRASLKFSRRSFFCALRSGLMAAISSNAEPSKVVISADTLESPANITPVAGRAHSNCADNVQRSPPHHTRAESRQNSSTSPGAAVPGPAWQNGVPRANPDRLAHAVDAAFAHEFLFGRGKAALRASLHSLTMQRSAPSGRTTRFSTA